MPPKVAKPSKRAAVGVERHVTVEAEVIAELVETIETAKAEEAVETKPQTWTEALDELRARVATDAPYRWYCTKACGADPWDDGVEPDACACGGNLTLTREPPKGEAAWRGGVKRHDGKGARS